jgi:uncharacterized protein YbcI
MGCGPKGVHAHLLGDLVFVRLHGVLTAAEQHLAGSLADTKGIDLLKQVRTDCLATARPIMSAMIDEVTSMKVVGLHHEISTATGEEVILFTLAESACFRATGPRGLRSSHESSRPRPAAGSEPRWDLQGRLARQNDGTSLSRRSWVTLNMSAFPAQSHNGRRVP